MLKSAQIQSAGANAGANVVRLILTPTRKKGGAAISGKRIKTILAKSCARGEAS